MAWQDRLRQGAYTSALGDRIVFEYEDVALDFDRQTAAFNFPNARGTYVQDLGTSSCRFPLRCIFSGANCDFAGDAFQAILTQPGIGQLEHPLYGLRYVIPFGTVTRRDDLVSAANQVVFEVVFFETIRSAYPSDNSDPESDATLAIQQYNLSMSTQFGDNVLLAPPGNLAILKQAVKNLKNTVTPVLQKIADTQDEVRSVFNAIDQSINTGIDLLIGEPLDLAFQAIQLIQTPARSLASIQDRLEAYGSLLLSLITGHGADTSNDFRSQDLFGSTYVTGAILSTIFTTFTTKTEALEAADAVFAQFDALVAWREGQIENLELIDTGEAMQQLQSAVALTAGYLIQISFTLKQERVVVLDRDRTIIDLCAELFGSLEDLDFFIASNNFTGSELIELKRGARVVYYL